MSRKIISWIGSAILVALLAWLAYSEYAGGRLVQQECYDAVYGENGAFTNLGGGPLPDFSDVYVFNASGASTLDVIGVTGNLYAGLSPASATVKEAKWSYMDCIENYHGYDITPIFGYTFVWRS